MDADAVETSARQLKSQAASIGSLVAQIDRLVSSLPSVWDGQDAQQFVHDWWPQHKKAFVAAQQQVDGLGQSALNNASEQRQVSLDNGTGSAGSSSGGGTDPASAGSGFSSLPNLGNIYRDFMDQTPIWPISVGTGLGMTPFSSPYADGAALVLDDRLSLQDKVGEGAHSLMDVAGSEIRQAGFEQRNLPLYLWGVAVSQWGDVGSEFSKADFSAGGLKTNGDFIAANPGEAVSAAAEAVVGYLPKLVSNWTFNPFGK
jgi:uncharacterized protein YukE